MSEGKPTPWKAYVDGNTGHYYIWGSKGFIVASHIVSEANANLIAQAPTLKAMNTELVEALEGVIRMTRPANSEDHDKVVAAYRALKNAKGE